MTSPVLLADSASNAGLVHRSAFSFEWFATYYILANKQGFIEKENLRAVYGALLTLATASAHIFTKLPYACVACSIPCAVMYAMLMLLRKPCLHAMLSHPGRRRSDLQGFLRLDADSSKLASSSSAATASAVKVLLDARDMLLITCVLGTDGSIFYKLDEQNAVGNARKAAAIANQDKKVKGA